MKKVITQSWKTFFIFFVFSSLLLWIIYGLESKSEIRKLQVKEVNELNGHSVVAIRIIDAITSDILFLSRLPDTRENANSEHLIESFKEISYTKKNYDQIRFLDINGQEKVRINWNNGNPLKVDTSRLQNKKGRYYFEETLKLNMGQVFISPLDLNVEYGKVEQPFKPMLRFGTPVFDKQNNKIGILLINYSALDLINEVKKTLNNTKSQFYFLNQEGYWLYSANKADEWGFMFPDKVEVKFNNRFPQEIWNDISQSNSGQILSTAGMFTFDTIYPLNTQHTSTTENTSNIDIPSTWKDYRWKVVSYVSAEQNHLIIKPILSKYIFLWVVISIIGFVVCFILAKSTTEKKIAELKRLEAERRYRVLFEQAGESIVVIKENKTLMANHRTEYLFEYEQNDLLSMPLEAFFHPDDRQFIIQQKKELLNSDQDSVVFEARILTRDGTEKYTEVRCTKLDFQKDIAFLYFLLDITARKKMENQLKQLATIDPLTECYNRRYFNETLNSELQRAKRLNQNLSLIMIDLDHFKNVNDSYGHDVGDIVLKEFAEITHREVRDIDTVARLGGEEFAIILPQSSGNNALLCAERLRITIAESLIKIEDPQAVIKFTASMGVSEMLQDDDSKTILKRIDKALYQAKDTGRNKSVLL